MADLRALIEGLGFSDVRTILNSGNAIFEAARARPEKVASEIERAVQGKFGFFVPVVVMTARDLHAIVAENPLRQAGQDPSKFLVAFVTKGDALEKAEPLLQESWTPEALAIGRKAAYLWCARGILDSKLLKEFFRVTVNAPTTRNWGTVLKLKAATDGGQDAA